MIAARLCEPPTVRVLARLCPSRYSCTCYCSMSKLLRECAPTTRLCSPLWTARAVAQLSSLLCSCAHHRTIVRTAVRLCCYRTTLSTAVRRASCFTFVLVAVQSCSLPRHCANCRANVLPLQDHAHCCATVRATTRMRSPLRNCAHYRTIVQIAVRMCQYRTTPIAVVRSREPSYECVRRRVTVCAITQVYSCASALRSYDHDHCRATVRFIDCASYRTIAFAAVQLCLLSHKRADRRANVPLRTALIAVVRPCRCCPNAPREGVRQL
jgi:hypothetical protein